MVCSTSARTSTGAATSPNAMAAPVRIGEIARILPPSPPSADEYIGIKPVIGFELVVRCHQARFDIKALGIGEHRFDHHRRHRRADLDYLERAVDHAGAQLLEPLAH